MSGDHEVYDELAVGWALHALEPEDEAAFADHLQGCDRCARTVAETIEVMADLAADLPAAEPSSGLRDRLRDAVARTEQVPERQPAAPGPSAATGFPDYDDARLPDPSTSAWRRAGPLVLIAAAVAVIVALGVWNVFLSEARTEAQAIAEEREEILDAILVPGRATIAPLTDEEGRSLATVVARHGQAQVLTHGLTVNDAADSTYVVWGIRTDAPVPLGTFDVVRSQMDLRTVGSSRTGLDDFSAYGISLEPGREAPSAPTVIVARGQVTS